PRPAHTVVAAQGLRKIKPQHAPPYRRGNKNVAAAVFVPLRQVRGKGKSLAVTDGPLVQAFLGTETLFQAEDCASIVEVVVRARQTGDVRPQVFVAEAIRTECEGRTHRLLLLGRGQRRARLGVYAALGPIVPRQIRASENDQCVPVCSTIGRHMLLTAWGEAAEQSFLERPGGTGKIPISLNRATGVCVSEDVRQEKVVEGKI